MTPEQKLAAQVERHSEALSSAGLWVLEGSATPHSDVRAMWRRAVLEDRFYYPLLTLRGLLKWRWRSGRLFYKVTALGQAVYDREYRLPNPRRTLAETLALEAWLSEPIPF